MSIRAAVYDLLDDVNARVYPLAAPQEQTNPYAVYEMRDEPERVQGGIQVHNISLSINIYANDRDDCLTLAASYFSGLEGATGSYSDQTLMICNWMSESEDFIPDLKKWNISQEYELKFQ